MQRFLESIGYADHPEHKQLAKCGSGEQTAALPATNVDAVHVTLLHVRRLQRMIAEHAPQALHADSRCQAVQGMGQQLGDEISLGDKKSTSRVGFKPVDECVAREFPPPAFLMRGHLQRCNFIRIRAGFFVRVAIHLGGVKAAKSRNVARTLSGFK